MAENNQNRLSRRDALKVLGAAAGATALANLPKKWKSPELLSGVLPAHAQTSIVPTATPTPEPACTDYAVTIEVISGIVVLHSASIQPDEMSWDTTPGSYVRWLCQSGCLWHYAEAIGPSEIRVTTISDSSVISFTGNNLLLINMDTGEYAQNVEVPVFGCHWPQ